MAENKTNWPLIAIIALGIYLIATGGFGGKTTTVVSGGASGGTSVVSAGCAQNPSYSYNGIDKYAMGTSVVGTLYMKENGNAPSSLTAGSTFGPKVNNQLNFWISNTSKYICPPVSTTAACGTNTLQAQCYGNSTFTVKAWDVTDAEYMGQEASGYGAKNLTTAANGQSNVRIDLQGTTYASWFPLGACLVVEAPSNYTSITASFNGAQLSACSGDNAITYTTSSTSNIYKTFYIESGIDENGQGLMTNINLQFQAGTNAPKGVIYTNLYATNYYIGNDGNFYKGIEKTHNNDATKTWAGKQAFSFVVQ